MSDLPQLAHDAPAPAPYKPNAILGWLYRRFFAHIHVDENWSRGVRDAASKGVVVYVMRSLSFLDFLCLDFLLKKFGLPLVRFVNDLGLWILEPFGKGDQRIVFKKLIAEHCDAVGVNGVVDHFKFMIGKGRVQIDVGNRGGKITHQAIDVGSHYSTSTKRGYT